MAGLSDLSFTHGVNSEALVSQRFGCPVSPPSSQNAKSFHLVASFGRSAVRLNSDSVSLILQACLGGNAKDFVVIHLSGWMFKFSVSCKNVGFMVYKLKSHSCKSFAIFFHLWSGGGPNWRKDHSLWLQEQDAEWHLVGSKSKKSYADVAKSSVKKLVFLRLSYPSNYASRFLEPPSRVFPSPSRPSIVRSAPKSFKRSQLSRPNGLQSWISKSNVRIQKAVSVVPQAPISNSNADPPPNPAIPNPACLKPLIECSNCLGLGHNRKFCQNSVRCRKC